MRVLVIEHDADVLAAIVRSLQKAGYAADGIVRSDLALIQARSVVYDAIVLNIHVKGADGWELLRALRSTQPSPLLLVLDRNSLTDRIRGLDTGADDTLGKPVAMPELIARLRALIRRAAGKATSQINIGDVTLDMTTRCVTKAGRPVALTAREYAIVELLMLHHGKLVSRTTIYNHVFDENEDTLSNLIDVNICSIRRKLGKGFIVTRRNDGYFVGGS